jgi:hypothetical protein
MDVQELRTFTRQQMDVDDRDLPDPILNIYLQEAFDRTMLFTNQWPRNETIWPLSRVANVLTITLPADLNPTTIISVVGLDDGYPLVQMSQEWAESHFLVRSDTAGKPAYYSLWGGEMYLWPYVRAEDTYDIILRGYRQPVWSDAASTVPDLDPRLHVVLAYYALALAYAKEEDEVMEGIYMARWQRDTAQAVKMITEPNHSRPMVMHGGSPIGGWTRYVVNPPVGA